MATWAITALPKRLCWTVYSRMPSNRAPAELECVAEHTELGFHRVAAEARQLDVVGDELGHRGVVGRIAIVKEVRAVLRVVAEPDRSVDVAAGLLDQPQLGRVRVDLPGVAVVAIRADHRRATREVVAQPRRERLAGAVGGMALGDQRFADDGLAIRVGLIAAQRR